MSRFGLRRKIKKILGMVEPQKEEVSTPKPIQSYSPQNTAPTEEPTVSNSSETKEVQNEVESEPANTQPPSEQDEKILKHRRRTKVALLKLTDKSDGTAPLGDLHDLAERRYFIAHKAFSDLMEEMVAEGLFLYDWSAGEATITELGKEWIQTDAKRGKK